MKERQRKLAARANRIASMAARYATPPKPVAPVGKKHTGGKEK